MWNLEGMWVCGNYHGANISGVVRLSRVKYGGTVSHHIKLDAGFSTCNGRISRKKGESVILDHSAIERLADYREAL